MGALFSHFAYGTVRFLLAAPLKKIRPGCARAIVEASGGQYVATREFTCRLVGWIFYDVKSSSALAVKKIAFVITVPVQQSTHNTAAYSYGLLVQKTAMDDLLLSRAYRRLGVGVTACRPRPRWNRLTFLYGEKAFLVLLCFVSWFSFSLS